MSDKERALLIRIRGLLMLAVDLIDRECQLGKYAAPKIIEYEKEESVTFTIPIQS